MKKRSHRSVLGVLLTLCLATPSFATTPQALQPKREALRVAIAVALAEPSIVGEIVAAGLAASILAELSCDPTPCVFDARYTELATPVVPSSFRPATPGELERFLAAPVDAQTVELVNRALRAQLFVSAVELSALTTVFRIYSADLKDDERALQRQRAHLASLLREQVPKAISEANAAWRAVLGRLEEGGAKGPLVTQAQLNILRDNPEAIQFGDLTRQLLREYSLTEAQIEARRLAMLDPVEGLRGPVSFAELVTRIITINKTLALTECACAPPEEAAGIPKLWLFLGLGLLVLLATAALLRTRQRLPA